ncbi:MAG: transcription termination factor NusA [Desulfobulbaceae bacterium]|jgi:transcription termination/antitermination protein NusA|nr:transcription termination factor NusA [Desulfobulbaceae bacterium]MDH3541813.1 transcription termination factor NusA [Desulfobulbaceae bacterium]MDH3781185.1 transcription termination factor NusA [Desulfobulbaceae bacterium]MDH3921875.1 transcription termination factor NusA [Desulfobulbaceae bacterium]HKJ14378.1 transcription termination factor NusA [Desulfobulbales bacterium]
MLSDLKRIIEQISRDKGIEKHLLVETIEEAVRSAARKKFGSRRDMEVQYNEELGEVEIFQFRTVVEKVEDEQTEISMEQASALDPGVKLHDEIGTKMENIAELGRIAAQSAKQVIIQKMKDAELDVIYDMYKGRTGEIVNGIVQRFERGNMIINLGRTDAVLPHGEQIPKRSFRQGDRIRALLLDVRQSAREQQLVLSRTNNDFLSKLFEMEVPEIAEGIVKIMGVSREPGFRAKIAVSSSETDVDPVGACVGMKGSRVQNVVQELQGERIDIVPWSPDPAKFVSNAMAPAEVSMVLVDEDKKSLMVVVPDDQLSLAIGRQGQNVRLASKLLGWNIDVKSESRYAKLEEEGYRSFLNIEGVDEGMADIFYDSGFRTASDLKGITVNELEGLKNMKPERAAKLAEAIEDYMQSAAAAAPTSEESEASEAPETESGPESSGTDKVRVYELAKEAGMKSAELADKLIELGYDIKGYSSSVDGETAEKIRNEVLNQ